MQGLKTAFSKLKQALEKSKHKAAADKHGWEVEYKENLVSQRFPKVRLRQTTGKDWRGNPTRAQKFYNKLSQRYY